MQRAGQAVETRRHRIVRIGQSRARGVTQIGADVAALVVRVQVQVEPHEIRQIPLRIVHAHHVGEVGAPVFRRIAWNELSVRVPNSIDRGGQRGDLGQQIERIFETPDPILVLGHPFVVVFAERGAALKREQADALHGHRMGCLGKAA